MTSASIPDRHAGRPTRTIDVIRFNYPTYLAAIVAMAVAGVLLAALRLPLVVRLAIGLGGIASGWWLAASTAAAAWVFEVSGVTRWSWLPGCFEAAPRRWLNLTTGFDDTSGALAALFDAGEGTTVDVFDVNAEHDGSILRARSSRPPAGASIIPGQRLPIDSGSCDAVFLLMAAHEVRDGAARRALLTEAARALTPEGRLVLVEHLRTATNAAVFGPGVLHFYDRRTWLEDARAAGLKPLTELRLTPFASAFVFAGGGGTIPLDM